MPPWRVRLRRSPSLTSTQSATPACHAARGPRAGHLRRLPRRTGPVGSGGGRRRTRQFMTGWRERAPGRPQLRVWFCAKGLRAHAELAALARACRDLDTARIWLAQSRRLMAVARRSAKTAAAVTPNTGGWLALAEAEYDRAQGTPHPQLWSEAAAAWEQLQRPPLAAYCRWREAEALVSGGASRAEAGVPLRKAHTVAARMGANPLLRELELLAQRSRLDMAPQELEPVDRKPGLGKTLGLTPREGEVLGLVATQTARSPKPLPSASRQPASTSLTSCGSSKRRTGSRRPRSRTASARHHSCSPGPTSERGP
jgi:hypothetical protein